MAKMLQFVDAISGRKNLLGSASRLINCKLKCTLLLHSSSFSCPSESSVGAGRSVNLCRNSFVLNTTVAFNSTNSTDGVTKSKTPKWCSVLRFPCDTMRTAAGCDSVADDRVLAHWLHRAFFFSFFFVSCPLPILDILASAIAKFSRQHRCCNKTGPSLERVLSINLLATITCSMPLVPLICHSTTSLAPRN